MKNLAVKLVKILKSIENVGKSGYNDHQSYNYTTEEDVLVAVKKALIEHNVFILQSSKITDMRELTNDKGKKSFVTSVETTNTFIDADSGESLVVTSVGQGHDSHDKGVFKAITGATKYMLLKNLMISSGDDPESTGKKESSSERESTSAKTNTSSKPAASNGGFGNKKAAPAAEAPAKAASPEASKAAPASNSGFGSRPKPAPAPTTETKTPEVTNDPVPAAAKPANSGFGAKKEDSKPSGFGSKTKAPASTPPSAAKADPEF